MFTRRTFLAGSVVLSSIGGRGARAGRPAELPSAVRTFSAPYPSIGSIERLDPEFDAQVPAHAKIEKLAEGFDWIEGPLWVKKSGFLLFSEIPLNSIYRWDARTGISVFPQPSGYLGTATDLKEPGSNGLGLGKKGELILCQHGERRLATVALASPSGPQKVVADRFDGKRFNSPNDLIVHSSGDIFFTDPPYGLSKKSGAPAPEVDDPAKELKFQGVYRVDGKGVTHLLFDGLERPNGIGLSPDEKILYVANSHRPRPIIMAFDVKRDRSIGNPRVFFDGAPLLARAPNLKGSFDGLTVAANGTLFASGPGGILVITPAGKHLGTISSGEAMSNCDFGGPQGKTLFVTSDMYLLKIETATKGKGF